MVNLCHTNEYDTRFKNYCVYMHKVYTHIMPGASITLSTLAMTLPTNLKGY